MLRAVIVWAILTLLVGAVTACPMINCPMQMSQSPDDCCSPASHSSQCPQHPSSVDCPYPVVEKALISKVYSSQVGSAAVAETVLDGPAVPLESVRAVLVREFLQNGSGRYLRLRILLI